jgi:anaerobic selenocysteine-containing dehydrogenase
MEHSVKILGNLNYPFTVALSTEKGGLGMDQFINYLVQMFARALIGTDNVDHCARLRLSSTVAGLAAAFGSGAMTNSIGEIENAGFIFVIGSNTTACHPLIAQRIYRAREKGAKLIVAAPRNIQLNTAFRPPVEEYVTALSKEQMAALTRLFQPTAEIIADFSTPRSQPMQSNAAAILTMLKRRPCTAQQIAEGFGLHINEVSKYLGRLMKQKKVRAER